LLRGRTAAKGSALEFWHKDLDRLFLERTFFRCRTL
jgi:hypothetical protein